LTVADLDIVVLVEIVTDNSCNKLALFEWHSGVNEYEKIPEFEVSPKYLGMVSHGISFRRTRSFSHTPLRRHCFGPRRLRAAVKDYVLFKYPGRDSEFRFERGYIPSSALAEIQNRGIYAGGGDNHIIIFDVAVKDWNFVNFRETVQDLLDHAQHPHTSEEGSFGDIAAYPIADCLPLSVLHDQNRTTFILI
jgi:hypothetical protein